MRDNHVPYHSSFGQTLEDAAGQMATPLDVFDVPPATTSDDVTADNNKPPPLAQAA